MTSEEKMREEFEAWARNEQFVDSGKDALGRYRSQEVDDMWYAWKSSRESLFTQTSDMVNRFLSWPLPDSVCVDGCAKIPGYPLRHGTNLLTADEAKAMIEYVLKGETK